VAEDVRGKLRGSAPLLITDKIMIPWDSLKVPFNLNEWYPNNPTLREKLELTITQASNGWIVRAGCLTLVFDTATLQRDIVRYLEDPAKVTAEYNNRHGNTVADVTRDSPINTAGYGYEAQEVGRFIGQSGKDVAKALQSKIRAEKSRPAAQVRSRSTRKR
jgi:hypothetical protein